MEIIEEWKDIIGYEGIYKISNLGRVKRIHGGYRKVLKKSLFKSGYVRVCLTVNAKEKTFRVHRLVAQTFIPNPFNKPYINHIDNNIENNHISNLEWCTSKENKKHCVMQNRQAYGVKNGNSKFKEEDIIKIRSCNLSVKEIMKIYKMSETNVRDILNRKIWKHLV